jgi:ferritin
MRKTPDTGICSQCEHTEPQEKTVYPSFKEITDLNVQFRSMQELLQTTYNYKRSLKDKLELLASFPHTEQRKSTEQRKYVLDKMNEIESYIISMVIKMYCENQDTQLE